MNPTFKEDSHQELSGEVEINRNSRPEKQKAGKEKRGESSAETNEM